jgi:hypothetical protein
MCVPLIFSIKSLLPEEYVWRQFPVPQTKSARMHVADLANLKETEDELEQNDEAQITPV